MADYIEQAAVPGAGATNLWGLIAILIVGMAGGVFPIIQPLFVGGLIDQFGLNATQGGLVASAEMAGAGVGIVLVSLVVPRANWHTLLFAYAVVSIVGNSLSYLSGEFSQFAATRFIAGIGQGALMGLATAALGGTKDPDRNFAIFMVVLFSFGTLMVYQLSAASPVYGIEVGYLVFAGLALLAALAFVKFPVRSAAAVVTESTGESTTEGPSNAAANHQGRLGPIIFGLAGILIFFTGLASVWPFMERIGVELNLTGAEVGKVLALSTSFGVAGGVCATLLADKAGRVFPVVVGVSGIVLCIASLYLIPGQDVFRYSSRLFMFFWIFVVPYLMGTIALLDPSGRAVVLNIGMQYLGFTIGPAIVGALVSGVSFISGLIVGLICCSLGLFIFVPLSLMQKKPCPAD